MKNVFEMNFEEFQKYESELIQKNQQYLDMFFEDLKAGGLADKTIKRHMQNAQFYIDEYLTRDLTPMEKGTGSIMDFFGYFFIAKCMWSTPGTIKTTAASLKKFYKCMMEHELVSRYDYEDLCFTIKECMEDWQADCAQYNDPDAVSPFDCWL